MKKVRIAYTMLQFIISIMSIVETTNNGRLSVGR